MSVVEKGIRVKSEHSVLPENQEIAVQDAARRKLRSLREIIDKGLQPSGNPLEALVQVGEMLRQTNDLPSPNSTISSDQDVPPWLSEYLEENPDKILFTRRDIMRATGRSEHLSDARTQTMFLEAYRQFEGEQWGGDKRISRKLSLDGFVWLCMKLGWVNTVKSDRAKGKKNNVSNRERTTSVIHKQSLSSNATERVVFEQPDKMAEVSQVVENDVLTALSAAFPIGTSITNSMNFAGKIMGVTATNDELRIEIEFPTYTSKIMVSKDGDGFQLPSSYRLVPPEEEETLIRDKRIVNKILDERQRELRKKSGYYKY